MKIVVTGGNGMLGRTLRKTIKNHDFIVADLPDWDITDGNRFLLQLKEVKPDVVIHCAAMTKVDDCESNQSLAYRLNEDGSRNVAKACRDIGARLIAISTDYVFSGDAISNDWEWTEEETPRPKTVYGMSKFAGEEAVMSFCPDAVVLRIAWLYGFGGPSFVHTMVKLGSANGEPLKVVDDQIGNPTSAIEVARTIEFLLSYPSASGIIHSTCEGVCSWYQFACEIKRIIGEKFPRGIIPCTTDEFPRPAPRPKNSALKNNVLGMMGYKMSKWEDALEEFIKLEFS